MEWIGLILFGIFAIVCWIYKASGGQEGSQSRKTFQNMGGIKSARLIEKHYSSEWKCEVGVFKIVGNDGQSYTATFPVGTSNYNECLRKHV